MDPLTSGLLFYKYQGTGNDFVIIDNRNNHFKKDDHDRVQRICDRHFGVGADGLILLENDPEVDFAMTYYNADGKIGTMCGNGGRCIVAFAHKLGIIDKETTFRAIDGLHFAVLSDNEVSLQMKDVEEIAVRENHVYLNTGSPHHIEEVSDLANYDVKTIGADIRYKRYGEKGSNINFVEQIASDHFAIRTYERGVEDETYSCGTGATATAIAMHYLKKTSSQKVLIDVLGGRLTITFNPGDIYTNVFLQGKVQCVFSGISFV